MSANTVPIFPDKSNISWATLTTANTAMDGTGLTQVAFVAGAEGSRIDQIKVRSLGTNDATVLRIFINNGQDLSVASNNSLVHEVGMLATTAIQTDALADCIVLITEGNADPICPIPYLPSNYKLLVTIGTSAVSGIQVTVFGADY